MLNALVSCWGTGSSVDLSTVSFVSYCFHGGEVICLGVSFAWLELCVIAQMPYSRGIQQ
jgi:hypothetical protein